MPTEWILTIGIIFLVLPFIKRLMKDILSKYGKVFLGHTPTEEEEKEILERLEKFFRDLFKL